MTRSRLPACRTTRSKIESTATSQCTCGIVPPALKIAGVEKLGAEHGEKSPAIDTVGSGECGFRLGLDAGERLLEQADLELVRRRVVRAEATVKVFQAEFAGEFRESLEAFLQVAPGKLVKLLHMRAVGCGDRCFRHKIFRACSREASKRGFFEDVALAVDRTQGDRHELVRRVPASFSRRRS